MQRIGKIALELRMAEGKARVARGIKKNTGKNLSALLAGEETSLERIRHMVSLRTNVTIEALCSGMQAGDIIAARDTFCYLARKSTGLHYPEIGAAVKLTGSGALGAFQRVEKKMEETSWFRAYVNNFLTEVRRQLQADVSNKNRL